jgi:hypothetical protein
METLEFKIEINASKQKVWEVLWNDLTYRQWTNVFCEGTYAVSDWNEGSKIHFLSPNGDGMNSIIEKKIDNEYIVFKHISELKDFIAMSVDEKSEEWSGAKEIYTLSETNGRTDLNVKMDVIEKYVDYFNSTFRQGLEIVKKLSEKQLI